MNPVNLNDPEGFAGHVVDLTPGIEHKNTQYMIEWANNYTPSQYNSVITHGGDSGKFYPGQMTTQIFPYNLAQQLKNADGYDPKLPTLLIICKAANNSESASAFAYWISVGMNGSSAGVYGSTENILPGPTLGSNPMNKDGSPVNFVLIQPPTQPPLKQIR